MKKFLVPVLLCLLMVAGMWVNSGNMSPYAALLEKPNLIDSKGNLLDSTAYHAKLQAGQKTYIVNYDHLLYKANFHMLNGDSKDLWWFNNVQRRILYYVIALPFMKWLGFPIGGFIATVLITLGTVLYTYRFIQRKYGGQSALFFLLLMSTYPGIMYWAGTSFAQVMVTPLCLLFYIRMLQYEEFPTSQNAWRMTCVFGIGFLGYDLGIYFIPAALALFCYKKQWMHIPLIFAMALPLVLLSWFYAEVMDFSLINDNTVVYKKILEAYANMDWDTFLSKLELLPYVLYRNYFDSQFCFWGILGIILFLTRAIFGLKTMRASGIVLVLSITGSFLFSNMAPPYDSVWNLEGVWIARIYQPLFVIIIFSLISQLKQFEGKFLSKLIIFFASAVFFLDTYAIFSPLAGHFELISIYERFYDTSPPGTIEANVRKFGAKPLGL